jgi:hypothetical protein
VFVFGQDNPILEAARVITDHLDLHLLTGGDWGDLGHSHHNFQYILCHSNGCTAAISAVESGSVSAKEILAMGTDWSTASIDQGRMHGTGIIFFVNKTDPVPMIPGISIQQVTEHAAGFGYKISFGDLRDATSQLGNLVTGNQPNTGSYLVVKMDPRPGLTGLKAHSLTDSYFPNVKEWLSRDGQSQQELRSLLNLPPNPSPASPPKPVSSPRSTASTPGPGDNRGGVFAGVPISDKDFAPVPKKGGKKQ